MIFEYITNRSRKKIFNSMIYILVITFTLLTTGCFSSYKEDVKPEDMFGNSGYKILSVVMKNGLLINLKDKGAIFTSNYQDKRNVVVYRTVDSTIDNSGKFSLVSRINFLNLNEIQSLVVEKEKIGTAGILLIIIGVILIAAMIIGGTSGKSSSSSSGQSSCPFIYSYDCNKYIFDAEPYGGAISEGLKKTDYSRLENLKADEGKYKLLIQNETDETQNTDEMKLLVIEHPLNTEVAPDINGEITVFEKASPPLSVTDENGKDVSKFFDDKDNVQWQTDMPLDTLFNKNNLKHDLLFKFPKPKDVKNVKLIINAGTALWGEYMLKRMLEYRGNKVDKWYEDIDKKGTEMLKLYQFIDREELFSMKTNVLENGNWINRGSISAGGPYIDEDRIIDLNIENVTGDTLYIKLNPPKGYWKFDYAGVIYESTTPSNITELPVSYATDENGNDVKDLLSGTDGRYYSMPLQTNFAKIEFEAPAQDNEMKKSLYLKTTGYYEIHLKKDKQEQTDLIEKIYNTPGLILEISMKEYIEKVKELGLLEN